MNARLFATLPFSLGTEGLPALLERGIQPEIALRAEDLCEGMLDRCERIAALLRSAKIRCTVHAPFHDLNPGAMDPLVTEVTRQRTLQCFDLAERLGAQLIVFHPGYERWKYGQRPHLWIERSLAFWPPLLDRARDRGFRIALENVFDDEPRPLADLLDQLDHPSLGHCFDLGHWHLFDRAGLQQWKESLFPRLIHAHLHDNDGSADQHRALGQGNIDLPGILTEIVHHPNAPTLTLEAHSTDILDASLAYLRSQQLL